MGRDEILRTWFMAELAHAREQGIAVDVEGVPYEDQTPDEGMTQAVLWPCILNY